MKYTVVWRPEAEDELAAIWLVAEDRDEITAVSGVVDRTLKWDPYNSSESRGGNHRILLIEPLVVYYRVSDEDRLITVESVWTR